MEKNYALADPTSGLSVLHMNNEVNLFGRKTYLIGKNFKTYLPMNDAPVEKEIVVPEPEKKGSLAKLFFEIVVAAAIGAVVATRRSSCPSDGVHVWQGASCGVLIVAQADYDFGSRSSWGDYFFNLTFEAVIVAMAGAVIYTTFAAIPVVSVACGLEAQLLIGRSGTVYTVAQGMATAMGYTLMTMQGINYANQAYEVGFGQNLLLDSLFDGNRDDYDEAMFILDFASMSYLEYAAVHGYLVLQDEEDGENSSKPQVDQDEENSDSDSMSNTVQNNKDGDSKLDSNDAGNTNPQNNQSDIDESNIKLNEKSGQNIYDDNIADWPSANGEIGEDFEIYLTKVLDGEGSRQVGGRDFDGVKGNRWWEAKSGRFWDMLESNPKALAKFKSDMGDRLKIAKNNGATYELFSNTPIPQAIKDWLASKGIPFTEILF